MKKMKLSEEEAQMIIDYRDGLKANSEDKKENNDSDKKEEEDMKGKGTLKKLGIGAAIAGALGGIGFGIYKLFFDKDDFDDFDEDDNSDEFEDEDSDGGSDEGLDILTEDTEK